MFFPKSNIIALVIHISPRPSTFPTSTSNLAREVSSSRSNGLKSLNSAKALFSFHYFPYPFMPMSSLCSPRVRRHLPSPCCKSCLCLAHRELFFAQSLTALTTLKVFYNYSGHSFRRGGATYASSLGISHKLIQLQGDWASTACLEYLVRPL